MDHAPAAPSAARTEFRSAAGQLGGVVALVIALVDGQPHATTASSGGVASLAPPLLTVSFAAHSRMHDVLMRATGFSLSVLRADDVGLARRFASPNRLTGWPGLAGLDLRDHQPWPPTLQQAVAWFTCRQMQAVPMGDHTCFVGEAVAYGRDPAAAPLLYYRGRFHGLGPPLAPAPWADRDHTDLSAEW